MQTLRTLIQAIFWVFISLLFLIIVPVIGTVVGAILGVVFAGILVQICIMEVDDD